MIKRINSPLIIHVQTFKVDDSESLDQHYADFLEQGYEGAMIRIDAPYEQKRSKTLQKRKEFIDGEFKVIRLEEGVGNWAGYKKIAICRLPNGNEVGAGIKGNQEYCRSLMNKDTPTLATLRYQNVTPDGSLRFPIAVNFYWGERDI
jgi:ATP-dependent DNA ligase